MDYLLPYDFADFSSEDIAAPISSYLQPNMISSSSTTQCSDTDWLSSLDEEEPLIFGASNFYEDAFLITHNTASTAAAAAAAADDDPPHSLPTAGSALEAHVPAKARSKRPRSEAKAWPFPAIFSMVSTAFSRSEAGSSSLEEGHPLQRRDGSCGVASSEAGNKVRPSSRMASESRRCAHCLAQKTPQWRAGPTGPKTLCNACGVRFKSGRLLAEYRPASSPTFLSQLHSNSHKRVMEMRRQKSEDELDREGKELKARLCLNTRRMREDGFASFYARGGVEEDLSMATN